MAFKADTTAERWTQVRQLTSDEDWEEVKKELVVYLLKASTDPNDRHFINPTVKIDLLLKEGYLSSSSSSLAQILTLPKIVEGVH